MCKTRNPDALIRIEDAIKVLCREKCYPGALYPDSYCSEMWDEFNDVERVDAVEVVRCKDCKHWYSDADTGMACEFTNMGQPDDGFCNWGERKDGDNETD